MTVGFGVGLFIFYSDDVNTKENVTSKMARKHAIAKEPAMKDLHVKRKST